MKKEMIVCNVCQRTYDENTYPLQFVGLTFKKIVGNTEFHLYKQKETETDIHICLNCYHDIRTFEPRAKL